MDDSPASQQTKGLQVIWPTIAVAIAAVLGYMLYRPAYESERPAGESLGIPPPPSSKGMPATYSRLWEDPLQPAAPLVEQHASPARSFVFGFGSGDSARSEEAADLKNVQRVMTGLAQEQDGQGLHVIPVMLPGGPFADDREQRMRIRYALLSALGACGYRLALPQRMTFVELTICSYIRPAKDYAKLRLKVPVKLYGRDAVSQVGKGSVRETSQRVLILWINETQLGDRPINALGQILTTLFGESDEKHPLRVSIVGPTNSDTLLAISRERTWPLEEDQEASCGMSTEQLEEAYTSLAGGRFHSTIYSFRATVDPADVTSGYKTLLALTDPENSELKSAAEPDEPDRTRRPFDAWWRFLFRLHPVAGDSATESVKSPYPVPKVVRTIGTDRVLVDALQGELGIRQALPRHELDTRHIVILTERDSSYGEALRSAFAFREETSTQAASGIHKGRLHFFTYLRGLDGAQPLTAPKSDSKSDKPWESTKSRDDERPEGRAQFDYLQRLVGQIRYLQEQQLEGEITAIGVMGTDVYDKLLLLRALRSSFPRAWFFTTDLDASLIESREREYTRNVLVASHFSLQLHPSLQRDVPAFRDCYQTSLFHTMLLIMKDPRIEDVYDGEDDAVRGDPWQTQQASRKLPPHSFLKPLVFEISRYEPYQLSVTGGPHSHREWLDAAANIEKPANVAALVHPVSPREVAVRRAPLRWLLTLAGVALLWATVVLLHPRARKGTLYVATAFTRVFRPKKSKPLDWVIALSLLLVVCFIIAVYFDANVVPEGEPLEWTAGISVWPTSFIRFAAMVLALVFLLKGYQDVQANARDLAKDFALVEHAHRDKASWLLARSWETLKRYGFWTCYCRLWSSLRTDRPPSMATNVTKEWRLFVHRSWWPARVVRVAPGALLFYLAGFILMRLWGSPFLPARGAFSFFAAVWILQGAVVSMLALLFFVLDEIQLCRGFIRRLTDDDATRGPATGRAIRWPAAAKEGLHRGTNYPDEIARELLNIRFTSRLTQAVGKLVFYPFVILFLMIVSRLRIFDNWDIPWTLLGIFVAVFASIVWASFSLRNTAAKGRERVLERLRNQRAGLSGQEGLAREARETLDRQYQQAIEEIQREHRGAFRPVLEDPIVRALAIPFGGVGTAVLIDQVATLLL